MGKRKQTSRIRIDLPEFAGRDTRQEGDQERGQQGDSYECEADVNFAAVRAEMVLFIRRESVKCEQKLSRGLRPEE